MKLFLEQEGDWVRCVVGYNTAFVNFLKYGVTPQSYRYYDNDRHCWLVHWTRLQIIVPVARRHFDEVDWSTLPDSWQIYLVGGAAPSEENAEIEVKRSPHEILFVTADAPLEVIRASYYALATLYHPDRDGDPEKMVELTTAYDQIRDELGSS